MAGEVGGGVPCPPELGELGERLAVVGDDGGATEALRSFEVVVQRQRVALSPDYPGAGVSLFVAPAHAPNGSVRALDLLDAHRA